MPMLPNLFSRRGPSISWPDAAADQAAHDTLAALFPSFAAQLNQMLPELAAIPAGPAKTRPLVGGRTATSSWPSVGRRVGRHSAAVRALHQPGDYEPRHPTTRRRPSPTGAASPPGSSIFGYQSRPPASPGPERVRSGPPPSTRSRASVRTPAPPGPRTKPPSPSSGRHPSGTPEMRSPKAKSWRGSPISRTPPMSSPI